MFVAGFFGSEDSWKLVAQAWKDAIAPRKHLHLNTLRFQRDRDKKVLERAGAVPKDCGLTPMLGGVRQGDYRDLISGTREEVLLNGYVNCCTFAVINALRSLPVGERLEVVFEQQDRYGWMNELSMRSIANSRHPELLLPDGTSKLANWRSVPKGSTSLTEPADYFAYALLQNWRNKKSKKSLWCQPILTSFDYQGIGAILTRERIRDAIEQGMILRLVDIMDKVKGGTVLSQSEFNTFNKAMDVILRANPTQVKAALELDKLRREEARKAKKSPSASGPASSGKD